MKNIKLVLIDFDDTLCLTEENGFHLENEVATLLGFKHQSRDVHQKTWGMPLPEVANVRFPGINIDLFMDMVGKTMAEKSTRQEFDVVSKQNLKTVSELKSSGYKVGIVTSRVQKEISHLISKKHPLMSVLNAKDLFYKEKTVYGKPDPRVFDIPLKYYQCCSRDAVYIGDSVSDAIAAKKAGLGSIISTESKLRSSVDFPKLLVDSFISKFTEIPGVINRVKNRKLSLSETEIVSLQKQKTMSVPHDLLNNK